MRKQGPYEIWRDCQNHALLALENTPRLVRTPQLQGAQKEPSLGTCWEGHGGCQRGFETYSPSGLQVVIRRLDGAKSTQANRHTLTNLP